MPGQPTAGNHVSHPMIDIYAAAGTFASKRAPIAHRPLAKKGD
jgi:hypothetical protein